MAQFGSTLYRGWVYLILLPSTMALLGFYTLLCFSISLYPSLLWLRMALLDSTKFYHIGLLGSTWPYLTSLYSTMALMGSTWLYYILYYGSTCLYFTLPHSNMALLHYFIESTIHSTWIYLHGSVWLYYTLPCMDLLGSTSWLYYTLPCMALLGCT